MSRSIELPDEGMRMVFNNRFHNISEPNGRLRIVTLSARFQVNGT
jgi:hypothetical protein